MKIIWLSISILVFSIGLSFGQSLQLHHSKADIYCKECHFCDKPTELKPCLICNPDFTRKGVTVKHSAERSPDIIEIDLIADQYEASLFPHRLHAEMADMAGGCILCHHYNVPGQVSPCVECHESPNKRTSLGKPDLKAAYHRLCLSCHLEWKHENDCTSCHALKGETGMIADKTNYIGKKHPPINKPIKKVYNTENDEGKLVTFYHDDHVKMYNLSCIDCHHHEKCARCHDSAGTTPIKERETHDNCVACHERDLDENCSRCHADKERPPFNHKTSTGWELKTYHQRLHCQACHGDKKQFTKVNKSCSTCHKSWDAEKFDHKVTGFKLDENHVGVECETCHLNNNFLEKPNCSTCHDDKSYPDNKPGKQIRD